MATDGAIGQRFLQAGSYEPILLCSEMRHLEDFHRRDVNFDPPRSQAAIHLEFMADMTPQVTLCGNYCRRCKPSALY